MIPFNIERKCLSGAPFKADPSREAPLVRQPAPKALTDGQEPRRGAGRCSISHPSLAAGQTQPVSARSCRRGRNRFGTAHYCLNAMIEKGLLKLGNFSASQDKRRHAYILTPERTVRESGANLALSQAQENRVRRPEIRNRSASTRDRARCRRRENSVQLTNT